MIDVENLGVQPDCPVLTIGCVQFDIHTGEIGAEFYERIDMKKAQQYGRTDISTLKWWMDQDAGARAEAFDGTSDPVTVAIALRDWFARTFPKKPFVWGNGSCMDIVQLEYWLRMTNPVKDKRGFVYPWDYYSIMDMRTIMRVAKLRMPRTRPAWMQHHNALHDARYQVSWVHEAMKKCRGAPLPGIVPPFPSMQPMPSPGQAAAPEFNPEDYPNIICD